MNNICLPISFICLGFACRDFLCLYFDLRDRLLCYTISIWSASKSPIIALFYEHLLYLWFHHDAEVSSRCGNLILRVDRNLCSIGCLNLRWRSPSSLIDYMNLHCHRSTLLAVLCSSYRCQI